VNIKIRVCQIIGLAAAGSAGPVPTALKYIIQLTKLTCQSRAVRQTCSCEFSDECQQRRLFCPASRQGTGPEFLPSDPGLTRLCATATQQMHTGPSIWNALPN